MKRNRRAAFALGTFMAAAIAAVAMIVLGSAADSSAAVAKAAHASPSGQPGAGASSAKAEIPEHGLTLGDPGAKVELVEFGDLTSPVTKVDTEAAMPKVIRDEVATGEAKLVFRDVAIMSDESTPAGAAAFAAGEQGRGWDFVEAFLARQRKSGTGYVDRAFLETVAKAAGVPDLTAWREARNGGKAGASVETTGEAEAQGLIGVPTFAVRGPGTQGLELLPNVNELPNGRMAASIEHSIEAAG